MPGAQESGKLLQSPYSIYQNFPRKWSKMFITVNGLSVGLELNREDLEVEHHTFLDEGVCVCVCVRVCVRACACVRACVYTYGQTYMHT